MIANSVGKSQLVGDSTVKLMLSITSVCFAVFLALCGLSLAGVSALALLALCAYATCDLETCLCFTIPLALVDPQTIIAGQRLYLDPLFLALWIPLLRSRSKPNFVLIPYFLTAVVLGAFVAINKFWFAAYSLRLLTAITVCSAVALCKLPAGGLRLLSIGSLPLALFGLYQYAIGDYSSLYFLINRGDFAYYAWRGRAFSVFSTDNVFGGFCAIISAISLGMAIRSKDRLLWLCFAMAVVGMLVSGSRGAVIGFLVAFVYLVSAELRRPKLIWVSMVSILSILAVSLYAGLIPVDRLQFTDFIIETRLDVWGAALIMFVAHPLVGVGLTNFPELLPTVIPWAYDIVGAHNIFLQILSEGGIVGFLALFVPLGRALWRSRNRIALAGIIASFSHQLVDFLWADPRYLMTVAVVLGAACASSEA